MAAAARVTVVGLGPAGPELVTEAARRAIAEVPDRFVRTRRHPSASLVADAASFDDLYESAARFEDVYAAIVEALVAAARARGRVLYAVPGSPRVAEATVEALLADGRVAVDVVPAMSFLDLVWDRLGIDPLSAGARVVDAAGFAPAAAAGPGGMVVCQCWHRDLLSEVKLAYGDDHPASATLLHHLGLDDEVVATVAWEDLDRTLEPDHLTTVWVPATGAAPGAALLRLAELVRTLRERCPWDREQTHLSLTRYLLEEAYEVLEAIEALGDAGPDTPAAAWDHLEEELGDLLFQVYLHAALAAEAGQFDLGDVATRVHDKLVGRHPHVFPPAGAAGASPAGGAATGGDGGLVAVHRAEDVAVNWERIKKAEKGRASLMEGIPVHLPALHYAHKVQRKAASVGFDWETAVGPMEKVAEELDEVRAEAATADPGAVVAGARLTAEVGDLLFSVVNVARHLKVDPEAALRGAASTFRRRFAAMEAMAAGEGRDLADLDAAGLDSLWERAKAAE